MKPWNDPVLSEAERKRRISMERNHPAFFLIRIRANFAFLVIALMAASRFSAELRVGWLS
jgi:hypothetical protein